MKKLTHTLLLSFVCFTLTVSAQKVTDKFVTESLLGESVKIAKIETKWVFAPDEPLKVTVLRQKWIDKQVVATVWIKTSDVEGVNKLEGPIKLTFTEGKEGLELSSVEDDGLVFKRGNVPVTSPVFVSPPVNVRRPVLLATGTNRIGGRGWRVWSFSIGTNGVDRIRGWFSGPNGGVQGLVLSVAEYENWKAGGTYFANYDSGVMKVGTVNIRLRPGNYVFVAFNPNIITGQAVRAELVIE